MASKFSVERSSYFRGPRSIGSLCVSSSTSEKRKLNLRSAVSFGFIRRRISKREMSVAMAIGASLILLLCVLMRSEADQEFNVRQHLSTMMRYGVVESIAQNTFIPSKIPSGCTPIHLNLVARHGTRSPTKKRLRELERLSIHLRELIKDAQEQKSPLQKVPAWLREWESPWKGKVKGGELISKGEEELYQLGIRVRKRFPGLFEQEYHPDLYTIKATQVPRASASAVAFGMGLFGERGNLGPGRHRAFAVTSESRASDTTLRFYDCCEIYKDYRKNQKPAVDKLKGPTLDEIRSALAKRIGLNFTTNDISSLWFLCKQEASLLDVTDQACQLFNPSEVALMEWTDDLEVFILKGYGKSLNYRMGIPLLKDVFQSVGKAIKADKENLAPGSFEKARLRFAHAETVIPFSCLLGLFLEGSEFEKIQKEEPLELPLKPPNHRNFKGSTLAPFGGNNMLVLYSCPVNTSSKYFVQVLHNEHPIPMPGCDGKNFCPFEVFREQIVEPHLKHDYSTLCNVKLEDPKQKSVATTAKSSYRD